MKTVVSTFLAFFFTIALFAQNFVADEFIVEYIEGTTNAQQQAVRDLFGITATTNIGENIELWEEIHFPITVTESGETTIINDVEELLYYINIQEGDGGTNNNTTANINNGNLNLLIYLDDIGAIYPNGNFDPLPYCDDSVNDRLIGPVLEEGEDQYPVTIIIVDQQITDDPSVQNLVDFDPDGDFIPGGDHGNMVLSVIKNQVEQANIQNVSYYNIVLFDQSGVGTLDRFIQAMNELTLLITMNEDGTSGIDYPYGRAIMNFSANIILSEDDTDQLLWQLWQSTLQAHTLLLVTSAGNQGQDSDNIYPACGDWEKEISVAGTQACFTEPWENSNSNPNSFDIAAEAENVLVHDGENYRLVNGTSFSSAFVTGAAAQLAARCEEFDPIAIKNQLLNYADENPNLTGLVNQGRTLNVSNAIANWESCGEIVVPPPPPPPPSGDPKGNLGGNGGNGPIRPLQSSPNPNPLVLTTTPNPFTTTALVTIELPEAGDVTISMYNMIGQRVHEELISNQQEMTELEWPTPHKLARGTYLLRVQAGEAVEQMLLVKQ